MTNHPRESLRFAVSAAARTPSAAALIAASQGLHLARELRFLAVTPRQSAALASEGYKNALPRTREGAAWMLARLRAQRIGGQNAS